MLALVLFAVITPDVSDLKSDESIALFPTYATRVGPGETWNLRVHGWVYETEIGPGLIGLAADLANIPLNVADPDGRARASLRLTPFLADSESGKRIVIRICRATFRVGRTDDSGHFRGEIRIAPEAVKTIRAAGDFRNDRLKYSVVFPNGDSRTADGRIYFIEPTGLSVISDIDDTIKLSDVTDRRALLLNTFVEEFRPVPGMAELYRSWVTERDAVFHYVSASPWQLFDPLSEFLLSEAFPEGTLQLRTVKWSPRSAVELLGSPTRYKTEVIERILSDFPQRKFALVGDDGEQDPEIYGELARRHRDQIVRILIRTPETLPDDRARFTTAFANLPHQLWRLFVEPSELRDALP